MKYFPKRACIVYFISLICTKTNLWDYVFYSGDQRTNRVAEPLQELAGETDLFLSSLFEADDDGTIAVEVAVAVEEDDVDKDEQEEEYAVVVVVVIVAAAVVVVVVVVVAAATTAAAAAAAAAYCCAAELCCCITCQNLLAGVQNDEAAVPVVLYCAATAARWNS